MLFPLLTITEENVKKAKKKNKKEIKTQIQTLDKSALEKRVGRKSAFG